MSAVQTSLPGSPTMTAAELVERLRRHYIKPSEPLPGGAFMTELTAPHSPRRIDALYLGFTRSRGERVVGHEIKVRRPDWLAELEQPLKAEGWFRHCHQWYVVAPSVDIVRPEELPSGWGLMVVNPRTRTRLDIVAKAAERDADVTTGLLFAVAKRLDLERAVAKREAEQAVRAEIEQRANEIAERELDRRILEAKGARDELAEWEEATGLSLSYRRGRTWVAGSDLKAHGPLLAQVIAASDARDRAAREIERTRDALQRWLDRLAPEPLP